MGSWFIGGLFFIGTLCLELKLEFPKLDRLLSYDFPLTVDILFELLAMVMNGFDGEVDHLGHLGPLFF